MSEQRAVRHWIDGAEAAGDGSERIEVVNPATAAVIADMPAGTAADIDRAVAAAQRAFLEWSEVPVSERAAAIARIAEGIKGAIDDFAATVTSEMGSPISYAQVVQAGLPYQVASSFAALADGYAWEEELGNALVMREPIGVVGAITPWNAPLYQTVAKVAPALLAGCTVVLKPSVLTPLTAALFAELTAAAGIPAGAFNIVYGAGSVVGEAISSHQGIDMMSFTGSTAAGKQVSISAAGTVKRVALELGGKSANLILDDADMQNAVNLGLEYAWMNGGQTCAAWTRMLVPASRHDEIVELAVAAAGSYGVGDPTDPATRIGPMSSAAQQGRVSGYIERGIADGATVVFGLRPGRGPRRGRLRPPDDLRRRRAGRRHRPGGDLRPGALGDPLRRRGRGRRHRQQLHLRPVRQRVRRAGPRPGRGEAHAHRPGHGQRRGVQPDCAVRRVQAERQRPGTGPVRAGGVPRGQGHPPLGKCRAAHSQADPANGTLGSAPLAPSPPTGIPPSGRSVVELPPSPLPSGTTSGTPGDFLRVCP